MTALNLDLLLFFSYPVDTNGWGSGKHRGGSHSATSVIKVNMRDKDPDPSSLMLIIWIRIKNGKSGEFFLLFDPLSALM